MKVIATKNGFYGRYISEGEVFEVPSGSKSTWFAPLSRGKVEKTEQQDETGRAEGDLV